MDYVFGYSLNYVLYVRIDRVRFVISTSEYCTYVFWIRVFFQKRYDLSFISTTQGNSKTLIGHSPYTTLPFKVLVSKVIERNRILSRTVRKEMITIFNGVSLRSRVLICPSFDPDSTSTCLTRYKGSGPVLTDNQRYGIYIYYLQYSASFPT